MIRGGVFIGYDILPVFGHLYIRHFLRERVFKQLVSIVISCGKFYPVFDCRGIHTGMERCIRNDGASVRGILICLKSEIYRSDFFILQQFTLREKRHLQRYFFIGLWVNDDLSGVISIFFDTELCFFPRICIGGLKRRKLHAEGTVFIGDCIHPADIVFTGAPYNRSFDRIAFFIPNDSRYKTLVVFCFRKRLSAVCPDILLCHKISCFR